VGVFFWFMLRSPNPMFRNFFLNGLHRVLSGPPPPALAQVSLNVDILYISRPFVMLVVNPPPLTFFFYARILLRSRSLGLYLNTLPPRKALPASPSVAPPCRSQPLETFFTNYGLLFFLENSPLMIFLPPPWWNRLLTIPLLV